MPGHSFASMENQGARTQYGGNSRGYGTAAPSNTTDVGYMPGALFTDYVAGIVYKNDGSATSPSWVKLVDLGDGVGAAGGFSASPRLCHTGDQPAIATTSGTNYDIVVTELLVGEVFVPCNMTVTGVAVFNGTAVAGNIKTCLFNSAGTRIAISASTQASGTTGYQLVPMAATILGPATYYIGVIGDNNGGDIRTHVVGSFGAAKTTSLVYATESGYATITPPTTFTTAAAPIASLY